MSRNLALIIFVIFSGEIMIGQQANSPVSFVGVGTGIATYTSSDRLLNYYNYKGIDYFPLTLKFRYTKNKSLAGVECGFNKARLDPVNINETYYDYNYIKKLYAGIKIEYFREMLSNDNKLHIYLGAIACSYITNQKEIYKNLLYNYAGVYRASYNISIFSIAPGLILHYKAGRNSFIICSDYTLFNVSARPDDNFVKQTGHNYGYNLTTHWPDSYTGFNISVQYLYHLTDMFGISAEYNTQYHSYLWHDDYRYLGKTLLIGTFKYF